jgi:hypothetical protein
MWVFNVFLFLCIVFNPPLAALWIAAGATLWVFIPWL